MAVELGDGVDVDVEFGVGLTLEVGRGVMVAGGRLVFAESTMLAGDGVASLVATSVKATMGVVLARFSTAGAWQPISSHIKLSNATIMIAVGD